jgi:hypothetical protein
MILEELDFVKMVITNYYLPIGDALTIPYGFLAMVTGLFLPHLIGGFVFAASGI